MFVDLNEAETDPFSGKRFDVCICGSGAAGITLAAYVGKHLNVALLEGGGRKPTPESMQVYNGEIVGRSYFNLMVTRLRYFGGTTNHWTGWSLPLDPHDFKSNPAVDHSGWPINIEDLDPYLEETKKILDIPQVTKQLANESDRMIDQIAGPGSDFRNIEFMWSAPTRFAEKYEREISESPNITCFLNTNVTDIGLSENLDAVSGLEVHDWKGRTFTVNAGRYVLATGGIENARLLLASNGQLEHGIGNERGLVGRFFTEHPHHNLGNLLFDDPMRDALDRQPFSSGGGRKFYAPTTEMMRRERIMNGALRVEPWDSSVDGFMKSAVKGVACNFEWSISAVQRMTGNHMACAHGQVRGGFEQALNPYSRITLGDDVDQFGMPRVKLDWKLQEIDRRSMRQLALRFGEAMAAKDIGRLQIHDWLLADEAEVPGFEMDEVAGHHHMCTTRMAETPRDGVVDRDQRVFGIDNLYVAGASIFGTGGHANPTFTIVQTSLRLADHLSNLQG